MTLALTLLSAFFGSLMFSYWLGLLLHIDIRAVGDGNPGASNLWTAAGFKFGLLGVLLDFLKGYLPVLLILNAGLVAGYPLIPIALAPIVGHAFSPFLKFNGGKSLATTFGVWSALTQFRASVSFAIILAVLYIVTRILKRNKKATSHEDGLQVIGGFLLLSVYLLSSDYPHFILWIWAGNLVVLLWKSREAVQNIFKSKEQKNKAYPS